MASPPAEPRAADAGLRVLVVPATARDGAAAVDALERDGVEARTARDLVAAIAHPLEDLGTIVLSDTALLDPAFDAFAAVLASQPAWSDMPVVLMVARDIPGSVVGRHGRLSNVTLIDRPTSIRTLTGAVGAALRARRRQYEIRDRIQALEQAEQALRDADRRKDEFLATLAHELRNPLAPIRNAAHILATLSQPPERTAQLAGMIQRQTRAMAMLLDDLLDVARVTSGKVTLRLVDVPIGSVVEAALEASRPRIEAKDHALKVLMPEPQALVRVDPLRMSQVLTNVLTNAAKYTDARGHIELEAIVQDGLVQFVVRDDGVGVESHLLPRLFEMFNQVPGTLDLSQGGLGIGLALSRALVELHGGRIEAHSEGKGRGALFRVLLPAIDPPAATATRPSPSAAPSGATPPNRRLVVADDNIDAATTMAMMLELTGWEVAVAHDGAQALALAERTRPAALLLDIGMPQMDGYEVARHVRARPWGPDAVLIATTGWGQPEDKRLAFEAGFDAHLTKPIFPEHVSELLAQRLPRLEPWRAVAGD